MADEQRPSDDLAMPDDPIPRIEAFLTEKGARAECPVCSNPTWVLLDNAVSTTMLPVYRGALFLGGIHGHDLYTFVCRNCGYVRSHLRSVVNRELDLHAISPLPASADHAGDHEGDVT